MRLRDYNQRMEIEYEETDESKQAVFDMLVAYCLKHGAWHGEVIQQCDGAYMEAAELVIGMVDNILKPEIFDDEVSEE